MTLKFNFVSTKKALSAVRDSESFKNSSIFMGKILEEFTQRANVSNS